MNKFFSENWLRKIKCINLLLNLDDPKIEISNIFWKMNNCTFNRFSKLKESKSNIRFQIEYCSPVLDEAYNSCCIVTVGKNKLWTTQTTQF